MLLVNVSAILIECVIYSSFRQLLINVFFVHGFFLLFLKRQAFFPCQFRPDDSGQMLQYEDIILLLSYQCYFSFKTELAHFPNASLADHSTPGKTKKKALFWVKCPHLHPGVAYF